MNDVAFEIIYGSAEDAAERTVGRHADVRDALQWLTFRHLPPQLQDFSRPFYDLACALIKRISVDSVELKAALGGVVIAKDAAMRAGIRNDTGRAGSVPRPQKIVDPPKFI